MTQIIYDDFLYNADMWWDRAVTCHKNGDFALSPQGDIQYTSSAPQAILQKVFLWMSTAKGEIPGRPDIGCCIRTYFHKKATPSNFSMMQREIERELNDQIPELGVKSVTVKGMAGEAGRIDAVSITVLTRNYGKLDMSTTENNMDTMNAALQSMTEAIAFIQENNQ